MRSAHAMTPAAADAAGAGFGQGDGATLTVRDLRVSFTQPRTGTTSEVVCGLNLDVPSGGSVAIVGESGSGKTVAMRALLGVLPETAHTTGSAMFDRRNLIGLPEAELRRVRGARVGMVFQNAMSALNPTRTLKVQLTEHLRWHGLATGKAATARAVEVLDRVGIPEPHRRIRMYPFQLSGGQRQRAMIAMAIAAQPELLIADEPTTALDVTVQRHILDLLHTLRREDGLALIMITHDLGVAKYLCDDIIVMRHGHLIETAPMATFITAPRHEYSQQLLNAALDLTTTDTNHAAAGDDTDTGSTTDHSGDTTDHGSVSDSGDTAGSTTNHGHGTTGDGTGGGEPAAVADTAPERNPDRPGELVVVRDLVKIFHDRGGDVPAVTDVDLTIAKGETVGIVGESGSGKSTLARLITRLIDPTAGSVAFDGASVLNLSGQPLKAWRRRVQMVFQNPYASLLPHQTVTANVAEPLRVHHVGTTASRRARAVELLTLVGIPAERVDQYPRQFSGGQQQRVAIARALALEPDLLVCDEPTSALDVSIQAQVLQLLRRLQEELGLSMLFITHNLAVAQQLCNQVVVMAHGHIIETAPTHDLFTNPQHPYTKALLTAVLPIRAVPATVPDHAVRHDGGDPSGHTTGHLIETSPGHWVRSAIHEASAERRVSPVAQST